MDLRPALELVTEDEQRALRCAVSLALQTGLATDGLDGPRGEVSNVSLVSVARKLGVSIPGEENGTQSHLGK